MYLWLSIDVDNYYGYLKEKVEDTKKSLGFSYGTNGLPYHISLKISFDAKGKENMIIKDIEDFYKTLHSFTIKPRSIEEENNILWVRYEDNIYLKGITTNLNKLLNEKYNIPYHEYDLDFVFHTTLYMSNNFDYIHNGYLMLKDEKLPKELFINKFLIGYSPLGLPETYSVLKEVVVK